MSRPSPTRFLAGLVIEGAALLGILAVLPKVPWHELSLSGAVADERPTLEAPQFAGVEQRLDQASQQLLNGAATYLQQHGQELLAPAMPADVGPTAAGYGPPRNGYRY